MRTTLLLLLIAACGSKHDEPPTQVVVIAPIPRPDPAPVAPPANVIVQSGPGGASMIGGGDYWWGTGPGFVYSCKYDKLTAWRKDGRGEIDRGPCDGSFQYLGNASGTYTCNSTGVFRIPAQGDEERVSSADGCILDAIDDQFVYYVVPGFEGVKDPGLYRVKKTGGTPAKLYTPARHGEQLFSVIDGDTLWLGAWNAGTISKMPKAGGPLTTVITGQKGLVNVQVDGDNLYWYSENTTEIRMRAKAGGKIKTIARDIADEPLVVHRGSVYYFRGDPKAEGPRSLMRIAPGAAAVELVPDLTSPQLVVDDEGIFFSEFQKPGIYALPLPLP